MAEQQAEFNYRRMIVADLPAVVELGNRTEGFEVGEDSGFWDETVLRRWITYTNDPLIVVTQEGALAGFILGAVHQATRKVTLENIVVAEEFRRQHLASGLLAAFMQEVDSQGVEYVCALTKVTNTGALRFFEESGFKRGRDFAWLYVNNYGNIQND